MRVFPWICFQDLMLVSIISYCYTMVDTPVMGNQWLQRTTDLPKDDFAKEKDIKLLNLK